jgi:hypothetical protein
VGRGMASPCPDKFNQVPGWHHGALRMTSGSNTSHQIR